MDLEIYGGYEEILKCSINDVVIKSRSTSLFSGKKCNLIFSSKNNRNIDNNRPISNISV